MLNDVERAQRLVLFCSTRAVAIFEINKGVSLGLYSLRISSVSSWKFVQPVFINGLIFVHGIFHLKKTNFQLEEAKLSRAQHWNSSKTRFSARVNALWLQTTSFSPFSRFSPGSKRNNTQNISWLSALIEKCKLMLVMIERDDGDDD